MNQKELKSLLDEAAQNDCSWQRRNEIHCMLGKASPGMGADGVYEIDTPGAGIQAVLDELWVETVQNRPQLLPALFPAFAVMCGDREDGTINAGVDWSLV